MHGGPNCHCILNLDKSLDTFLMVLDIFNDESENSTLRNKRIAKLK